MSFFKGPLDRTPLRSAIYQLHPKNLFDRFWSLEVRLTLQGLSGRPRMTTPRRLSHRGISGNKRLPVTMQVVRVLSKTTHVNGAPTRPALIRPAPGPQRRLPSL